MFSASSLFLLAPNRPAPLHGIKFPHTNRCDCALAQGRQSRLSGPIRLEAGLQGPPQWEPQSYSPPGEPRDPPHEPILTIPAALTAYVLLLAIVHLRVLLPVELENWTIDVFGFIPKRYDSTLLNITFPGGAGAKIWTR